MRGTSATEGLDPFGVLGVVLVRVARDPSDHGPLLVWLAGLVVAVRLLEVGVIQLSDRRHQLRMRITEVTERLLSRVGGMHLPARLIHPIDPPAPPLAPHLPPTIPTPHP